MTRIVWSSWISDERGRVDFVKVVSLASVILGFSGAVNLLFWMIGFFDDVPAERIKFVTAVLVTPLFGGSVIAGAVRGTVAVRNAAVVRKIQRGEHPGRRGSDSPTTEERESEARS